MFTELPLSQTSGCRINSTQKRQEPVSARLTLQLLIVLLFSLEWSSKAASTHGKEVNPPNED